MKMPSDTLEVIVESIYHEASQKESKWVSEGGPAVDDRWWQALRDAYREGYAACKRGDPWYGKPEDEPSSKLA